MILLNVDLENRSYPIYIGSGLIDQAELLSSHIHGKQVLVVSNEVVAPLYLKQVVRSLSDYQVESLVLADGETTKTMGSLGLIYDCLMEKRFNRDTTIIALGGGVVGDMVGFAAATFQRGINFIQIPTTLLAQVDSSVGGKTAVNHALGKNMIGAFYQPQCVIADTEVLSTLADRELKAGLAEVIKYGLIRDVNFLVWLEDAIPLLLGRDPQALMEAIEQSCRNKAEIVALDETEQGVRAILNLGHTFGHAIEAGLGYGNWLHGEAVGAGMCMAASLSAHLEMISHQDVLRVSRLIESVGLPTKLQTSLSAQALVDLMKVDKKVSKGKIRMVLLEALGVATVLPIQNNAQIAQVLDEFID